MSAKLMGLVFELDISGEELPVMLALADHARDDGSSVYPSVGYLAWKTNRSERSVQRILRTLEERGLIAVVGYERGGRGHAREYVLHIEKGDRKSPYQPDKGRQDDTLSDGKGRQDDTVSNAERVTDTTLKGDRSNRERVTPTSPQPSVETLVNRVAAIAPLRKHERDELWDVCVELYGPITNDGERGKRNRAIKRLRQSGATVEEVRRRDQRMRQQWRNLSDFTANGLADNWSKFAGDDDPGLEQINDQLLTNGWYRHGS